MDHERFDRAVRALANPVNRRTGLLAALALAAGVGEVRARLRPRDATRAPVAAATYAAAPAGVRRDVRARGKADAGRRRRRKRCRPACEAGFLCERGRCVCGSGIACGETCCTAGETCIDDACAAPTPLPACLEWGASCKNLGIACCTGLSCGSGQGGGAPVCCQVDGPRTCASTAECCYGWECRDGRCVVVVPPTPTPEPAWRYAACPRPDEGVGGQCVVGATCCEGGGCCPPSTPVCCHGIYEGEGCCPAGYSCHRRGNGHGFCCPPGMGGNQDGTCVTL